MAVTLFQLNGVSYRYNTDEAYSKVLSDVTCCIPEGGVVAVVGPSGCGKSTLLNLLGLLLEDHTLEGNILFRETDYSMLDRRARTLLRRSEYGFVLQSCYLLANFTCQQNVAMPLALFDWTEEERDEWARTVIDAADPRGDLMLRLHHLPRNVSLGQRQRMAVLRAIIHDPRVVFADEPTSNLDPGSARAILDLLRDWLSGKLHQGGLSALESQPGNEALRQKLLDLRARHARPKTLFFVCHHLETARDIADHVLLFDKHHRLAAQFRREEWVKYADRVNEVLKLSEAAAATLDTVQLDQLLEQSASNEAEPYTAPAADFIKHLDCGLRFACWFARTELWAVGAKLVTIAMIAATALSSLGAVVSIAVPELTRRVNLSELEANPFSRCLWVSGRGYDRQIDEERRALVESKLHQEGISAHIAAYHETDFELPDLRGAGLALPKGRVVSSGDPLFAKLPAITARGRSFADIKEPAVILSSRLAAKFEAEGGEVPRLLRFRAPQTGEDVSVEAIDVSRDPLPQGDLYYLNDAADELLRSHDFAVDQDNRILTGPVPEGWDDLPSSVQKAFSVWKLQPPVDSPRSDPATNADIRHWVLSTESKDDRLSSAQWLRFLQQINELMIGAGRTPGTRFAVVSKFESDPIPAPPRGHFDRLMISAQSLTELRPTAEAIERLGMYVNDSAIHQLQLIERIAERQRSVSYVLAGLFCVGAVLSLFLMLFLRSRQKAPQIGMLRAMGADDQTLAQISAMEAGMIWIRGTALSLIAACVAALGLWGSGRISLELLLNTLFEPWFFGPLAIYLLVSFVACIASGWLSSRKFRQDSPAISLGLGN